jgi:hypothetical protein
MTRSGPDEFRDALEATGLEAARYRWIRERAFWFEDGDGSGCWRVELRLERCGGNFDRAVDAARGNR